MGYDVKFLLNVLQKNHDPGQARQVKNRPFTTQSKCGPRLPPVICLQTHTQMKKIFRLQ